MSEIIEEVTENGKKVSESSDSEYDPDYKPIISLPEVVVPTNEENEIELLKMRAKLYRFVTPEWKERGTGDLKLLQHKENNSVRVVMRRDKTLKVCANHFIVPWMELKRNAGSEKAFVYNVLADFADEIPKSECLAIKFATIENAALFKEKFEEAKDIVKTKCSLYNGKCDEESSEDSEESNEDEVPTEVIDKLSQLDVSTKEEDK